MEEKDIKILEEYLGWLGNDVVEMRGYEKQALENLLKAYKQDEEVIDEMAEYIDSWSFCAGGDCIKNCKEHIKEYFRKKVETNE